MRVFARFGRDDSEGSAARYELRQLAFAVFLFEVIIAALAFATRAFFGVRTALWVGLGIGALVLVTFAVIIGFGAITNAVASLSDRDIPSTRRSTMRQLWLFVVVSGLGGLGALLGSMLGNAAGRRGLFAGAMIGGVLAIVLAVRLAARFGLIPPTRVPHTTLGGLGGFALAAFVAVNTLSTPIGPVLSVVLIGLGAIFGAARRGASESPDRLA